MASAVQQADLTKLTMAQLGQLCRENRLSGWSKRRKSYIVQLLEKCRTEKGELVQNQGQDPAVPVSTSTAKKTKTASGGDTTAPSAIATAQTANTTSIHVSFNTDMPGPGSQNRAATSNTAVANVEPTKQKSTTKKKPKKTESKSSSNKETDFVRNGASPRVDNTAVTSSTCADGQAQISDSVSSPAAVFSASTAAPPIPNGLAKDGGFTAVVSRRKAIRASVSVEGVDSATKDPTVARALHFLDQVAKANQSFLDASIKDSAVNSSVAPAVARPPAPKGHQVGNGFSSSSRVLDRKRLSSIKRAQKQSPYALPLSSLLRRRSSRESAQKRLSRQPSIQQEPNDPIVPTPLQSSAVANSMPFGKAITSRKSIGKHQRFTPLRPTVTKSPLGKKRRSRTQSFIPASALLADTREMFEPFVTTLQEATFPLSNITMPPSLAQRKRVKGLALVLRDLGDAERRACCLSSRLLRYAGKIERLPQEMEYLKGLYSKQFLSKWIPKPMSDHLWTNPSKGDEVASVLSGGMLDESAIKLEKLPGNEIWRVFVSKQSASIYSVHVLASTGEPLGRKQSAAAADFSVRPDWLNFVDSLTNAERPPKRIKDFLKWTNGEEFENGISKAWLRRIEGEGELGIIKRQIAEKYVMASVVANSISGKQMTYNQMAMEIAGNSAETMIRPRDEVNILLPDLTHVENGHNQPENMMAPYTLIVFALLLLGLSPDLVQAQSTTASNSGTASPTSLQLLTTIGLEPSSTASVSQSGNQTASASGNSTRTSTSRTGTGTGTSTPLPPGGIDPQTVEPSQFPSMGGALANRPVTVTSALLVTAG
ncbi:6437_t:CDS:2, partial [Acaulospora colombiana]